MDTIRAEKLVKTYGKTTVVNQVSIDLHQGEIVGLLGPNGAGKSTTFKMLTGFIRPTEGNVFFGGKDVSGMPIHMRARQGIGYLPQETSIFRKLTVRQNLMAVLQALGKSKKEIRPRANRLLAELGVDHLKDRIGEKLSGGEKRRVEIARALMTEPKFLFLDEPFTGVDPRTVEDIQGIIKVLRNKGLGILITDHNIQETTGITDRSFILWEGEVLASGNIDEIIENRDVQEKFFTEPILEDLRNRAARKRREQTASDIT